MLVLGIFSPFLISQVSAYNEQQDGLDSIDVSSRELQRSNSEKLLDAIRRRQRNYFKTHYIENGDYKSRYDEQRRHQASKARGQVDDTSTGAVRSGDLKNVPYYSKRRANNQAKMLCPNNYKSNFRNRAINYYLEGGVAGSESICQNSITSSKQSAIRTPDWWRKGETTVNTEKKRTQALITSSIRYAQRNIQRNPIDTPTGYQKTTQKQGGFYRNFTSPYIKSYLQKDEDLKEINQHRITSRRVPARSDFNRGYMFWQDKEDGSYTPGSEDETFNLEEAMENGFSTEAE